MRPYPHEIIFFMVVSLIFMWWMGYWDKFIAVAVEHFPLWHWGG